MRSNKKIDRTYKEKCVETMSEHLVSLRAKVGLTQEEMASFVGISRQTYCAIESQNRQISWNVYLALLLVFDFNKNTHSMLRGLNIFPKELIDLLNNTGDNSDKK